MQARQLCPTRSEETQAPASCPFLISWDVTFVLVIKMAARAPAIASEFQALGWKREEEGAKRDPQMTPLDLRHGLRLRLPSATSWSPGPTYLQKRLGSESDLSSCVPCLTFRD